MDTPVLEKEIPAQTNFLAGISLTKSACPHSRVCHLNETLFSSVFRFPFLKCAKEISLFSVDTRTVWCPRLKYIGKQLSFRGNYIGSFQPTQSCQLFHGNLRLFWQKTDKIWISTLHQEKSIFGILGEELVLTDMRVKGSKSMTTMLPKRT